MLNKFEYQTKYDEDDFKIKKSNRRRKIDKRAQAHEDFMRVNGIGLKKVILPLIIKKGRESHGKE